MPVAKDQIRKIISENNINSVADMYALLEDSFKDILRQLDNTACDYGIKERKTSIVSYQLQLPEAVKIYLVSKKLGVGQIKLYTTGNLHRLISFQLLKNRT